MKKITNLSLSIEDLRRRAKDNKSTIAGEFSRLSESYLDKTRNILFLISFALLGYLGAVEQILSAAEVVTLVLSISLGLLSYFLSYGYALTLSHYYSDLEDNLSTAFPTASQYDAMLQQEDQIGQRYASQVRWQVLAVGTLAAQALCVIWSLLVIFT